MRIQIKKKIKYGLFNMKQAFYQELYLFYLESSFFRTINLTSVHQL